MNWLEDLNRLVARNPDVRIGVRRRGIFRRRWVWWVKNPEVLR